MKTPNDELTDHIVETLNRAIAADRDAMFKLFEYRVPCNNTMLEDPTVQVVFNPDDGAQVGLLGVLNGIVGLVAGTTSGAIAAKYAIKCSECEKPMYASVTEGVCVCGGDIVVTELLYVFRTDGKNS
jgi:hypothetical protein